MAASLPDDWHTPVGAGATPLPRGVAQRIGLVRALVQQPVQVLVLVFVLGGPDVLRHDKSFG